MLRIALLVPSAALFLLPGWLLGRIARTPLPAVTPFLGSAALVFNLILFLDFAGLPLTLITVGCSFAVLTGALGLVAIRGGAPLGIRWRMPAMPVGAEWIWVAPPVLALASIGARAIVEPLSGYDTGFRWDYLARLILTHHSLAFYPPVRAEDFDLYSWCDGIPPLAPVLNFLIYAAAGSGAPGLISLRPVSEFLLLSLLTFRFARELWGRGAGWPSLAALGGCTLLIWGVAIEQETGLTAISLVAMTYFLQHPAAGAGERSSCVLWAGVSAGVGAISREYGLYFVILGALLLFYRGERRQIARFLAPALLVAAPWYLRNWAKTGNPVFPALGRIFPTNAVHAEIMGDIAHFWGFRSSPVPMGMVPWVLAATAGPVLALGFAGLVRLRFRSRGILAGILLVSCLWAWSMPLTAGGWNYSMRVLVPALVLGSVLAGWIGTAPARTRVALGVLLALVSLDAARRAWLMPDFPFTSPSTFSFAEWRRLRAENERQSSGNVWSVLAKVAGGRFIAVDSPMPFVAVTAAGGRPTPFTSPRFAPALDPHLSVDEAVARLRASHFRFVTFSVRNPVVDMLIERHATLRQLAHSYQPAAIMNGLLIFDLDYMNRSPPLPKASR